MSKLQRFKAFASVLGLAGLGAFVVWNVYRAVVHGEVYSRHDGWVTAKDDPIAFWSGLAIYMAATATVLVILGFVGWVEATRKRGGPGVDAYLSKRAWESSTPPPPRPR